MREPRLLLPVVLAVVLAAADPPTTERHRTTGLAKTSEVIQKVVQAAIRSASSRRAYSRTRVSEPAAASAHTTYPVASASSSRPTYRLATRAPDKPRHVYHSSYKNSSGVIQPLPTIRADEVARAVPGRAPPTPPAPDVGAKGTTRPPKRRRRRKYPRKLAGNATTRSTLAGGPGEASSINKNVALKILRPDATSESPAPGGPASPASFETPPGDPPRVVGVSASTTRRTPSSLASVAQSVYGLSPLHADADRWHAPSVWSPRFPQFQATGEPKNVSTGNISLIDSHIKIAHISPKALSSIAAASTTDRMKLFSVTIKNKNSVPAAHGTTEKFLETSSAPLNTTSRLPFVTSQYKLREESTLPQRSKEVINVRTTAQSDTTKLTTRTVPVLSVKLNATREMNHGPVQKQSHVANDYGNSLILTSPAIPEGNILVGLGTTVEVSWKQSVTKSTTPPPKPNNIKTKLLSEAQSTEDFFKLLHDMTSSTYKSNFTYGSFDKHYNSVPRNGSSNFPGRTYTDIQRIRQDGADIGQVQYSGISNSVVIPDVSEATNKKLFTSKGVAVSEEKIPYINDQVSTFTRPVPSSTQTKVQQKSIARQSTAAPSTTRAGRRQVFMFRTPVTANEIQKSSESEASEVTFRGTTAAVSRPTLRTSRDTAWPSANRDLANLTTTRNPASSSTPRSRRPPAVPGRRATTLPPETTGRFLGWLATLQGPSSTARKTTRDTTAREEKPQTSRLQRISAAMQTAVDALMEVPRQIWLLPIRFGLYPFVNRVQEEVPTVVKFPCAVPPSSSAVPSSVHRLRPGDIRVVAALGDSIAAANGALASTEEDTRLNYRGVSAVAGGQAHWRKYLTLPNILKEFNPRLLGYSLGTAGPDSPLSGLNVAESGALDDQLLKQARALVAKARADKFIDFDRDWKLVNILIGGNDICNEYCFVDGTKDSPSGHRQNLEVALDYLQTNLPRTFVNLIHIPNMVLLRNITNVPFSCYMKQTVLCSCLFGSGARAKAESVASVLRGYWDVERTVATPLSTCLQAGLERYDTDNFTVVLQPFFIGVRPPGSITTVFGQAPDLSYFAPDCFHFSQKGNALVANALWNNMLEPVGNKTYGWQPLMTKFRCPSAQAPFLFTGRNSRSFLQTGLQDPAVISGA